jgi:hypothetical protein
MSATGQSTAQNACARWMPRKETYCARGAGHPPPCATPEAMERQRQRAAEQRPTRVIASETKARWNKTHRFVRFGITEERFDQMLESQGNACAICREPFHGQRICVDHDHACCPVPPSGHTRSCGKCVRGLLCVRCNTWLGWLETYGSTVGVYLASSAEIRAA